MIRHGLKVFVLILPCFDTPVAATARRPPAVEERLLAARRVDARARYWRPLA